ncbi:abnormal spindle microcephaly associated-like protein, partial [Leptotrombidium deliense]
KIWRGYKSRSYVFEIKIVMRCDSAARVIQRSVKSFLFRKRLQKQIETKRNDAALTIQKIWRGYKTRCHVFELNEQIKEAYRCDAAACVLQRSVKLFLFRKKLQIQREKKRIDAALTIQKIWRGYKSRHHVLEIKETIKCDNSVRIIQRSVKSFLLRRRVQKKMEMKRNAAALMIQKIWRGYQTRCCVFELKEIIKEGYRCDAAARVLQRSVKSFLFRRRLQMRRETKRNDAALKIQVRVVFIGLLMILFYSYFIQ